MVTVASLAAVGLRPGSRRRDLRSIKPCRWAILRKRISTVRGCIHKHRGIPARRTGRLVRRVAGSVAKSLPGPFWRARLLWSDAASTVDLEGSKVPTARFPGAAVEISHSGQGVHIWGTYRGTAPAHSNKDTQRGIVIGRQSPRRVDNGSNSREARPCLCQIPQALVTGRMGDGSPAIVAFV